MNVIPQKFKKNAAFIGREREKAQLIKIANADASSIVIVSGRRRSGKTELLEQSFRHRNVLKFEGVEGQDENYQRAMVMRQLAKYTQNPLLNKITAVHWLDVFDAIYCYVKEGTWTVYFEEVQWLANYKETFISELKFAWDNQFRYNAKLIIILCGSSPSFMLKKVIYSKSLYNRSQYEIHLQPFTLAETQAFLPKRSKREIMDAYLTLGGIPEYLKCIQSYSSLFLGICEESFLPNSYFSQEYQRIFVSSMNDNPYYKNTLDYLSQQRFATREQIASHLNIKAGGRISELLEELCLCGFVKKYAPYNLNDNSKLARYQINDPYLQFFYKFIYPQWHDIQQGKYQHQTTKALNLQTYQQWLGYAFERYCLSNAHHIAEILGFSGIKYIAGTYYNRATTKINPGYQIDLLFDREDHVMTICEIKYTHNTIGTAVIDEFEKKCVLLKNNKNKTLHKVLISASGADNALMNRHYFDDVIILEQLI